MKDPSIHKVLVFGSGPIVIGQACEFDYAGTQALKALKEEGVQVVLLNSNPATIMTDPDLATATYIEPMTPEVAEQIIARERPDSLLATMGGQTALNLAKALAEKGVLAQYGVRLLGAQLEAINTAEDRSLFKACMKRAGIPMARSQNAASLPEALEVASTIGYPVIVRTSFTLGGAGGGIARSPTDLELLWDGHPLLIEENLLSWKEFELEAMRDNDDNMVIVCAIENIDPMGVHTGDSITVAPPMTLTDRQLQQMRNYALQVVRAIGLQNGGCNIQFALEPATGRIVIIEMNPRVSRSSALASKATGYPIAKIAAKLALGYTLGELKNDITRNTTAAFEPSLDYVVVKIPRFDFDKFPDASTTLGTAMHAVGEVMAIGRTFHEAFAKALRSLDVTPPKPAEDLLAACAVPTHERIFHVLHALSEGVSVEDVAAASAIDPWFLRAFEEGFTPSGKLVYRRVDTCAGEFAAHTPYLYSTYGEMDESAPSARRKVLILGSGPNRIGQGIEFDYCCVHASMALREAGFETIMLNCNPETVSTDFDTSDKLYFEPITLPDVMNVINTEKPEAVIVQLGGQAPLKLAHALPSIVGTPPDAIDICEDRARFSELVGTLGLRQPENGIATSQDEALAIAERLGYPLMVRPSYVLGGRAMRVVPDASSFVAVMQEAFAHADSVLVDRFLEDAIEVDLDLMRDHAGNIVVCGVLEHIEEAGVHSGDAASCMPPHTLSPAIVSALKTQAALIAHTLSVVGFLNVQFAVIGPAIYVIEANPRASRTIPFIAKATGVAIAKAAALVMLGSTLPALGLHDDLPTFNFAVKESVLPFRRFAGSDPMLGPEMKSTGEVMGRGLTAHEAFFKAQLASGQAMPTSGAVYLVGETALAARLETLGFSITTSETEDVSMVIACDNAQMRRHAIARAIPYFTTVEAARMAVLGMETRSGLHVSALQEVSAC